MRKSATKNRRPGPKPKPATSSRVTKVTVGKRSIQEKRMSDKQREPDLAALLKRIEVIEAWMEASIADMEQAIKRRPPLLSGRWPRRDGDNYDMSAEPPPKEVPDADPETRDL
jgi:hypothetical protein